MRFTRDQCLDLPDTTYQTLEIPLSKEQLEYYDIMKKKAMIEYAGGNITASNAAVLLNKLLQISAGAVKNDTGEVVEVGCAERVSMLIKIFDETPQHKLVVFATYRASIELVINALTKHGINAKAIHGDVPQNVRAKYIEDFQSGSIQILVLQPQSSAHGITLTAASTIVWFSLIASNELYEQGNARIIRAGQIRKTQIIKFVSTKAENHINSILERKGNLSREVLDLFKSGDL